MQSFEIQYPMNAQWSQNVEQKMQKATSNAVSPPLTENFS